MYERFAPQTPAGVADSVRGIREIMVGTGGANHTGLAGALWANSEVNNENTFGVLKINAAPHQLRLAIRTDIRRHVRQFRNRYMSRGYHGQHSTLRPH